MSRIDKDIDVFVAEVKKNLICSDTQKKNIVHDIKNSILDYVAEHNITDINDIYNHFGEPEEIAKQVIADLEPQKIKKAISTRRIVLIGVVIAVLLFAVVIISAAIDGHIMGSGYTVDSPVIELLSEQLNVS